MHTNVRPVFVFGDPIGSSYIDRARLCSGWKWMRVQTKSMNYIKLVWIKHTVLTKALSFFTVCNWRHSRIKSYTINRDSDPFDFFPPPDFISSPPHTQTTNKHFFVENILNSAFQHILSRIFDMWTQWKQF